MHVVTGGPGSGKSSLIEALSRRVISTVPEAGRAIIRDQMLIDGPALPWADRAAFAEQMLGWELRSHREAALRAEPVIFDRGVPDVIGYLTLCKLPVADHIGEAARLFRYNRRVFLAPFWPEIFTHDAERKQHLAEAKATCEAMRETYRSLGYELVDLPCTSVEERADFVLERLGG
tara:strand:+ start:250 stop:777 length:528 start_codon:yes stop_codon:yes gene_type:complete